MFDCNKRPRKVEAIIRTLDYIDSLLCTIVFDMYNISCGGSRADLEIDRKEGASQGRKLPLIVV